MAFDAPALGLLRPKFHKSNPIQSNPRNLSAPSRKSQLATLPGKVYIRQSLGPALQFVFRFLSEHYIPRPAAAKNARKETHCF